MQANALVSKIAFLRRTNSERDRRWADITAVRNGELEKVFGDAFSDDWPKPVVANLIDSIGRDIAETLARMPSLNCSSGSMVSDSARAFADKRTKIVNYHFQNSQFAVQHLYGADHYSTYGYEVCYIEPDFDNQCPRPVIESPLGSYPEFDRWGRLVSLTKVWRHRRDVLARMFPEHARRIIGDAESDEEAEVARYCDDALVALVLLGDEGLVLSVAQHKLGRVPAAVAKRPNHTDFASAGGRGHFDDVIWVQIARHYMGMKALETVEKAVDAPLQVPKDVIDVPFGPDAVIHTDGVVKRVPLDVPQGAFAEGQLLRDELNRGTRYSPARAGDLQASIITGQGVEALMQASTSYFDAAQTVFEPWFREIAEICFVMDETYWPNVRKQIRGQTDAGAPFSVTYVPRTDIKGDHTVDVSYGFGLDPNRAAVLMLQLQGAGALSTDTLQRYQQIPLDVTQEQKRVTVEKLREGALQGILAYTQAIPAFAQSGQDPSLILQQLATVVKAVEKGRPIEEAVAEAFTPPEPEEPVAGEPAGEAGPGGPGGGLQPSGLLAGVAPGQAGLPPGGMPDIQTMLAGISPNGRPQLGAAVSRRRRV